MKYWKVPVIVLLLSLVFLYLDLTDSFPLLQYIAMSPLFLAQMLLDSELGMPEWICEDIAGIGDSLLRTIVFAFTISLVALPWFLWQLKHESKYLKLGIAAIVIYLITGVAFYLFLVFILVPVMSWG